MILYTNGCSFTAGGGLEEYVNPNNLPNQADFIKEHTWPKHLGDNLGVEKIINHGRMCGSNHRILRKTFDFLSQTEHDCKDIIVGIQFTNNNRFEYYESYSEFNSNGFNILLGKNNGEVKNLQENDQFSIVGLLKGSLTYIVINSIFGLIMAAFFKTKQTNQV